MFTFASIISIDLNRYGRKITFLGSAALLAATMLGYMRVSTYEHVLIIRALESISNAILTTTTRTYAADLMRPEIRGFGMGLYMTIVDESSTMGAILSGWIKDTQGFGVIFLIGAATAAICFAITLLGVPEPNRLEHNAEKPHQLETGPKAP